MIDHPPPSDPATNRDDLIAQLREMFPAAAARDARVSPIRGGRAAAEDRLAQIDPARYTWSRNELTGHVTGLSPYIRYGVLGLTEVRDAAINRTRRRGEVRKLIQELAWRDYFQRAYAVLGTGIWQDQEPYKTGFEAADYTGIIPDDVRAGTTGMVCIDAFVLSLGETGYLHNHARMWLAAYLVHWRRVRWQAGAAWFLEHLLDGDPASNNLNWQWVASTFAPKPYVFNRENLEQYTGGVHCRVCPLRGRCAFEGSYDDLGRALFPLRLHPGPGGAAVPPDRQPAATLGRAQATAPPPSNGPTPSGDAIVWVHGDCLSPTGPALTAHPGAPAVWVWDDALIDHWNLTLKRLVFLAECLQELPVVQCRGNVVAEILAVARSHGAARIVTTESPSPRFAGIVHLLRQEMPVEILPLDPFLAYTGPLDLARFSRYWRVAQRYAFGQAALFDE